MKFRPLPVLALGLLLGGCQPAPAPQAAAPQATADAGTPETPVAEATPVVQQTADIPTLQVDTVNGGRYDLAEYRGKWVVVNFWATWCSPCLKEMPELSALHAMRSNIEVVGLAYEDIEPADMRAFLEKHPVAYPIAIIDTYDPPKDFATPRGLPMTYLIAPDGRVARQFLGPVTAPDIEAAIAGGGAG